MGNIQKVDKINTSLSFLLSVKNSPNIPRASFSPQGSLGWFRLISFLVWLAEVVENMYLNIPEFERGSELCYCSLSFPLL